jgi:hypothetical protein
MNVQSKHQDESYDKTADLISSFTEAIGNFLLKTRNNSPRNNSPRNRECYQCGKLRHYARDCYRNASRNNGQPDQRYSYSPRNSPNYNRGSYQNNYRSPPKNVRFPTPMRYPAEQERSPRNTRNVRFDKAPENVKDRPPSEANSSNDIPVMRSGQSNAQNPFLD